MKRISLLILAVLLIFLFGCENSETTAVKHEVSKFRDSEFDTAKGIHYVNINIDSANFKIYFWDKKEIRVEAKHTIRDNKTIEKLEKLLDKYSITSENKEDTYFLTVKYNGRIDNPEDIYTDIKLTIPRKIKEVNITQQAGNLIFEDKYTGNINANLTSVNTELKSLKGQIILECKKGNMSLNSGTLLNNSSVKINNGNIRIKAQCQSRSEYSFETETGNIELNFPIDSDILLQSSGRVKYNQFCGIDGNIHIKTSAKTGEISASGY
jgi:DUF4097 and DUF4098 domain-containing protein YvlB